MYFIFGYFINSLFDSLCLMKRFVIIPESSLLWFAAAWNWITGDIVLFNISNQNINAIIKTVLIHNLAALIK